MNYKITKLILFTLSLGIITYCIYNSQRDIEMSDLAMANVEALADNESIYDYKYPKTIACDLQEGPWHTASVERICVFSATPSTCTPVACGEPF